MSFLFSQMGLALRLLSLAHRVNRQNGGPPATETSDGFLSDLPFALDQRVLRNSRPIISLLMGDYVTILSYYEGVRED